MGSTASSAAAHPERRSDVMTADSMLVLVAGGACFWLMVYDP